MPPLFGFDEGETPSTTTNWSAKLTRPNVLKDGAKLETLGDAAAFILEQPAQTQQRPAFESAAGAGRFGQPGYDRGAVSRHEALFPIIRQTIGARSSAEILADRIDCAKLCCTALI